ncbi:MAG: hypothetical protein K2X39_09155, partial [Silvanigrellaceae bacterium]|nr:hypothetical protein [Silvanigrellaceae bacterium]
MNILVINCGSSTIKFQLVFTNKELISLDTDDFILRGMIEGIGGHCLASFEIRDKPTFRDALPIKDHKEALEYILQQVFMQLNMNCKIEAVGHRVVHGANKFSQSVLIDAKVIQGISDCIELAPLHNCSNLKGILAIQ